MTQMEKEGRLNVWKQKTNLFPQQVKAQTDD